MKTQTRQNKTSPSRERDSYGRYTEDRSDYNRGNYRTGEDRSGYNRSDEDDYQSDFGSYRENDNDYERQGRSSYGNVYQNRDVERGYSTRQDENYEPEFENYSGQSDWNDRGMNQRNTGAYSTGSENYDSGSNYGSNRSYDSGRNYSSDRNYVPNRNYDQDRSYSSSENRNYSGANRTGSYNTGSDYDRYRRESYRGGDNYPIYTDRGYVPDYERNYGTSLNRSNRDYQNENWNDTSDRSYNARNENVRRNTSRNRSRR